MSNKIKYIFAIISLCLLFFTSCNDKKDELCGISIDPAQMLGTPSEKFSLQHVRLFQISNNYILNLMPKVYADSNRCFALAPFYAMGLIEEAELKDVFASFISTVKQIDSSIVVKNSLTELKQDTFLLEQEMVIELEYFDTCKDDCINLSGEFLVKHSNSEHICEIPIGNGNYGLMLIQPNDISMKQYLDNFDERYYIQCIKGLEMMKINVSLPALDISTNMLEFNWDMALNKDSVNNKTILSNVDFQIVNSSTHTNIAKKIEQNNSEPLIFDKNLLILVRDKNSNLIIFIGYIETQE